MFFLDLGFNEIEAEELSLRAFLMSKVREIIRELGLTQAEAAKQLRIDQPRVSKLFNGRMSRFSTDKLISYLLRLGYDVNVQLNSAPSKRRFGKIAFSGHKRKHSSDVKRQKKSA